MPGHLAAPAVQAFPDPPSDALLRFAHSCFFAALSRRPSLRSARGCATRQASPAVSLSLKRQASPAARTLSLKHSHITVELEKNQRAGVVALFLGRKARQGTERRGPMGPRPTHLCLVRETRLLPPKAGRLASRSAKPTLDGSSLMKVLGAVRQSSLERRRPGDGDTGFSHRESRPWSTLRFFAGRGS